MERNIPHVFDIFTNSPGERRRALVKELEAERISSHLKDQDKNAGSDSAVSLGSSEEDDENDRNISKYFEYLNEAEENLNCKKKKSRSAKPDSRKRDEDDYEKDIKHIEKHLSMKKTIRKKMMRDLQQAFVENPGEFHQDPEKMPPEKKRIIDLHNLTITKKKMSKSEHSFLDMLKDDGKKKKGDNDKNGRKTSQDEDSGLDSPTRSTFRNKSGEDGQSKESNIKPNKDEKKLSFWKRLTGKSKNKR